VRVHQLISLDATKDENDIIMAGVGVATGGNVVGLRCFFARPIRIGKIRALGIHANLSNLRMKFGYECF
jgi:hypothetical protein